MTIRGSQIDNETLDTYVEEDDQIVEVAENLPLSDNDDEDDYVEEEDVDPTTAVIEQVHAGFEKLAVENTEAQEAEVEEVVAKETELAHQVIEVVQLEAEAVIEKEAVEDPKEALEDVAATY